MLDLEYPWGALARGLVLAAAAVVWTVLLVRLVGLRSFSKMTAFDFVTTVATGSLIAQASTRSDWGEFLQAMAAIAGIFLIQWLLAKSRLSSPRFKRMVENKPVLLMEDGEFLEDAMAATRVSHSSILEKLRAANVARQSDVRAVVLETTGDISVISKDGFDPKLLDGVERVENRGTARPHGAGQR